MSELILADVLRDAAESAFKLHKDPNSAPFREVLFAEFLTRWHFSPEDLAIGKAPCASGSYLFLFHKNLAVTNISLIELISLVRAYAIDSETEQAVQIGFFSTAEYKNFFVNLWEAIFIEVDAKENPNEKLKVDFPSKSIEATIKSLLRFHEQSLRRTIVFDSYFTSAIIHVPRSLKVDIRAIAFQSGYIHSCGPALFSRQIERATKFAIVGALDEFFERNVGTKFFLTPYASEYFDPYESDSAASVRNGLDGVRIQLRKHFLEDDTLVSFLGTLQTLFPDKLIVPSGAYTYSRERDIAVERGATEACTMWFITDRGFVSGGASHPTIPDRDTFLFLYAQLYLNYPQLNIFKERKPAWLASTTLPHTLSAAMINVTRAFCDRKARDHYPVILDPFCGTGTTLLDSALRYTNAMVVGLDRNPLMPAMVRDNIQFFSRPRNDVAGIAQFIKDIKDELTDQQKEQHVETASVIARVLKSSAQRRNLNPTKRIPKDDFAFCIQLLMDEFTQLFPSPADANISDLSVSQLSKKGFSQKLVEYLEQEDFPLELKIVCYSLWRALVMNTFSIRTEVRGPKALYEVFIGELNRSCKEYTDLESLLDRAVKMNHGTFEERIGKYSHECSASPQYLAQIAEKGFFEANEAMLDMNYLKQQGSRIVVSKVADSIKAMERFETSVDVIITDPPYGFNYDEGDSLQGFFAELIPAMIKTLRHRGQLIMALPAFARNGKQIPYYQTRGSIVRQLVASVEGGGRRLVRYADALPGVKEILNPPWYWGSGAAVERRIVHFVVESDGYGGAR